MIFEKINNNKIKVTLDIKDLEKKNIDFHSFMANPLDSQEIFLDILDEAEREIGFTTSNSQVTIEALFLLEGVFILLVTKSDIFSAESSNVSTKLSTKRKIPNFTNTNFIYKFDCFADLSNFCTLLFKLNLHTCTKNVSLYNYNGFYYLVFNSCLLDNNFTKLKYYLSEFGDFVNNYDNFIRILNEHGNIISKDNAIVTLLKYCA